MRIFPWKRSKSRQGSGCTKSKPREVRSLYVHTFWLLDLISPSLRIAKIQTPSSLDRRSAKKPYTFPCRSSTVLAKPVNNDDVHCMSVTTLFAPIVLRNYCDVDAKERLRIKHAIPRLMLCLNWRKQRQRSYELLDWGSHQMVWWIVSTEIRWLCTIGR